MAVTGSDVKLVFCEGKAASLDVRLLNALVSGPQTQIVPAGGKRGFRAFIDGHLSSYGAAAPRYVAFRDRDFDVRPPETVGLIRQPGAKPMFLSYRACVESYLLDPDLIDAYWAEHRTAPNWKHGDSPGKAEIAVWLEEAARDISDYQAVRWALAGVKPAPRWPEVRTTWTDGSGDLPPSLEYGECQRRAEELVREFHNSAGKVTAQLLHQQAEACRRRFADESFWRGRGYLVWFHGKDVIKAMHHRRPASISLTHFCSWAAGRVDWRSHPDLADLAAKLT